MSHKLCVYVTNCVYLSRTVCHEPWVCVTYSGYIRTTCHEVWKCVTNCGYVSQTLDMPHELCTCVMNCEYVSRIICHELRIVDSYDIRNTKYGNESRTEDICHDNKPVHVSWTLDMGHELYVMNYEDVSRTIQNYTYVSRFTNRSPGLSVCIPSPVWNRIFHEIHVTNYVSRTVKMCHELCISPRLALFIFPHAGISHVTYGWVMAHMDESWHVWMSHVIYEWVMSYMNESWHIWMSHVTYGWVMSYMDESCHTWMSHVTYGWVMSYIDESCHVWMSHVTYWWVMS